MTTGSAGHGTTQTSHEHINALRAAEFEQGRRKRLWIRLASVAATLIVIVVVAAMALTSRQVSDAATKVAPDCTLRNTSGAQVSLASYRERMSCCTSARAPAARPASCRWP